MYQRLTTTEVAAVERALAAGMRHVEIARELDLSVWTIARIADRRNRSPHAPREESITRSVMSTLEDLFDDDGPPDYQAQNLRRCPGCGAMIYVWPCIACRMANAVPAAMPLDGGNEDEVERLAVAPRPRTGAA